jgi:hypothetical protein
MNKHLSSVCAAGRNNNILWSGGDSKTIFDQLKASARQNTKQNHRQGAFCANAAAGEPCRANNVRANERANKYKIGKSPQMFCSLSPHIFIYIRAQLFC